MVMKKTPKKVSEKAVKIAQTKRHLVIFGGVLVAAIVLGGGVFAYASVNKTYQMDGPSMLPTISSGDKVKARVVPASEIKHGDIIVFESMASQNAWLVKRVVGLPGDIVSISKGALVVTKADTTIYVPYDDNDTTGESSVVVGPYSYYVIGDNRANSLDSRLFGPVSFDSLLGVVKE